MKQNRTRYIRRNFPVYALSGKHAVLECLSIAVADGYMLLADRHTVRGGFLYELELRRPGKWRRQHRTLPAPVHKFSSAGLYTVTAIVSAPCGTSTASYTQKIVRCSMGSLNDRFGAKFSCRLEVYELIIANRWGEILFRTNDQNNKWDGLIKGKEAELGVYYYTVKYAFPARGSSVCLAMLCC